MVPLWYQSPHIVSMQCSGYTTIDIERSYGGCRTRLVATLGLALEIIRLESKSVYIQYTYIYPRSEHVGKYMRPTNNCVQSVEIK